MNNPQPIASLDDLGGRVRAALGLARSRLLAARGSRDYWAGGLSSSALSTATAVCALAIAEREDPGASALVRERIAGGLAWLAAHANADGGWGDTGLSLSNISTTTLCWAAFGLVPEAEARHRPVVAAAGHWLQREAGSLEPRRLAVAIIARYGEDRTFSVPILTLCAISGRLGTGREAWAEVIPLPFELAVCPPDWFAALRLPVVSYALPAF